MNKNIFIMILVAVIIIGGVLVWYWMGSNNITHSPTGIANITNGDNNNTTENFTSNNQNHTKGTIYLSIASNAANIGTVNAVTMTIDTVQVYSKISGWITVSKNPQTFHLLALKDTGQTVLLGKVFVPAYTYNDFRFHIAKVTVTASGKTSEATLPSHSFNVSTDVMVNANTVSAGQFTIVTDKSLYQTDDGQFVFIPVVRFDSRVNATVKVGTGNVMSVSFGQTNASVDVGMDIDGKIKTDFVLDPTTKLDINSDGTIRLNTDTYSCRVVCAGVGTNNHVKQDCVGLTTESQCGNYRSNDFPYSCMWVPTDFQCPHVP